MNNNIFSCLNKRNQKVIPKGFSLIELSIVILIIGILVAGIVSGSRLYLKSKVKMAQSLTNSSPAASIANMILWYETSLDSSFANNQNSDNIKQSFWMDINPQRIVKYNVTQSTPENQPTFYENVLNGLPSLRFDGSSVMNFGNNVIGEFLNTDYTIFLVSQQRGTTANAWGSLIGTPNLNSFSIGYSLSAGINSMRLSQSADVRYEIPSYSSPIPYVTSVWFSQSSGKKIRVNGAGGTGTSTSNDLNPITNLSGGLSLGRFNSAGYFVGDMFEVIIYNRALTNEERYAIEGYLGQKYSIPMVTS